LTSNGVGAGINLSCYTLLIFSKIKYFSSPLIALAIASLIAMTFNFLASKYFVFQPGLYNNDRLEAEES
jgi:putative flippase GtrA